MSFVVQALLNQLRCLSLSLCLLVNERERSGATQDLAKHKKGDCVY